VGCCTTQKKNDTQARTSSALSGREQWQPELSQRCLFDIPLVFPPSRPVHSLLAPPSSVLSLCCCETVVLSVLIRVQQPRHLVHTEHTAEGGREEQGHADATRAVKVGAPVVVHSFRSLGATAPASDDRLWRTGPVCVRWVVPRMSMEMQHAQSDSYRRGEELEIGASLVTAHGGRPLSPLPSFFLLL
jgi:hypothetical protein